MAQYRKKSVVIEADRVGTHPTARRMTAEWCSGRLGDDHALGPVIYIDTPVGQMVALVGDWIIKGSAGEFYPCGPDIFDATYEAV